jgi:hypothetical protein
VTGGLLVPRQMSGRRYVAAMRSKSRCCRRRHGQIGEIFDERSSIFHLEFIRSSKIKLMGCRFLCYCSSLMMMDDLFSFLDTR